MVRQIDEIDQVAASLRAKVAAGVAITLAEFDRSQRDAAIRSDLVRQQVALRAGKSTSPVDVDESVVLFVERERGGLRP